MRNTVFFFPSHFIREKYYSNKYIYFYDNSGLSIFKNGKRSLTISSSNSIYENVKLIDLIQDLRFWGPMWSRMIGTGDQYELILRKTALLILTIANNLRRHKIKLCIMPTGVTHHVDSLIFDLACKIANVKKIFMYRDLFLGRLLPIIQDGDYLSRKTSNFIISDVNYNLSIKNFILNKKKGNDPILDAEAGMHESFLIAFFYTAIWDLKFLVRNLLKFLIASMRLNSLYKPGIFSYCYNNYPFQMICQLIQSYQARNFYKKNMRRNITRENSELSLIIAAHYQPEASTFPEGWFFSNHIDLVHEIRRMGYKGKIYYKEHSASFSLVINNQPTSIGMFRSIDYYKQLISLGCIFLDNNFDLTINQKNNEFLFPVTITGTVAIERSLFGYKTIVAGRPYYQGLPGALSLSALHGKHRLEKNMFSHDKSIAKKSYSFLLRKLNNKTIFNAPLIGTGGTLEKKTYTKNSFKLYCDEIHRLLEIITLEK